MNLSYELKWICSQPTPPIEWIHAHLSRILGSSAPQPLPEPLTTEIEAGAIYCSLLNFSFTDAGLADTFRKTLWGDLLGPGMKPPRPFAVSFLPVEVSLTQKKLVVFDMDSTLINQEVIDELAKKVGTYEQVAMLTDQAMRGNLSFKETLVKRCKFLMGLGVSEALEIIPTLTLSPGGESLLSTLKSQGIKTAVVSGGFQFILQQFKRQYSLDFIFGNTLSIHQDGAGTERFTGEVEEPIIDAEGKRERVAALKAKLGVTSAETIVVGDGANDLLMMNEAGTQVSFCGKPKLAAYTNTLILDRNLLWLMSFL